ncbi:MAG: B12-binding domain-containing radical SAM protein [Oscillospiraceae bacterium]|nr:B12-binding domain-containing radical SAM protein [Oscillospiraceae bacterium]
MNALLLAINSKYIHTNLAVRYLKEYSRQHGISGVDFVEYTINQHLPNIIDEVYRRRPPILLLSCYIWNVEMMLDFAAEYKLIAPETIIIAGGPEVSYNSREILEQNPAIDMVLSGEGEKPFTQLMEYFEGRRSIEEIRSLSYRQDSSILETSWEEEIDLAELPFAYMDLPELQHKIVYFESIRGCPFRCSYCLSSIIKSVRYMPLEQACAYLQIFLDAKVPQVKFVDRTFNCQKEHAMGIWKYLVEHDNGVTNFHFELTAHLIDEEMLQFLSTVRQGLFQFEIGVQSTNEDTIKEIRRATSTDKLLEICRRIDSHKNIHLHLDLIAGLPHEGLDSFGESFDRVMAIRPQQMQLGFLKILKGSHMAKMADSYGMIWSKKAPFQVYSTRWISYDEMMILKDMEEMVETYYNSGLYDRTIRFILDQEPSDFAFFRDMGRWWYENGHHRKSQSPEEKLTLLRDFFLLRSPQNQELLPVFEELCLYDVCRHGKPKKLPQWLSTARNLQYKAQINAFFDRPETIPTFLPEYTNEPEPKKVQKLAHLQVFSLDPRTLEQKDTAILFNYRAPDLLGNAREIEAEIWG